MKKLEDFPTRADFKVPEGYFEDLPSRIQSRISGEATKRASTVPVFVLRYALPLAAVLALGVFWYVQTNSPTIQDELATFNEVQLSQFLEEPDLTSEELAESVTWSTADLDALEEEVYGVLDTSTEELDVLIDELDLENI
jgi:hypothetical protein